MVRGWRVTHPDWHRRNMGVGQGVFCPFFVSYESRMFFRLWLMSVFLQFPQELIRPVKYRLMGSFAEAEEGAASSLINT